MILWHSCSTVISRVQWVRLTSVSFALRAAKVITCHLRNYQKLCSRKE